MRSLGGGRYSHWGTHLFFTTSDNSDPRSNGRRYTVKEMRRSLRLHLSAQAWGTGFGHLDMCGIAGLFSAQRAVPEAGARDAVLRRMTHSIAHRGPDDEGIWHDSEGRCSLGHRRLSIIDTSAAGHQPMVDASERWVISYNGEIYNFEELRAQLQACGIAFRGRTDTEVLLQALALWGVDALAETRWHVCVGGFRSTSRAS